jgi:hypothetical protein
MGTVQQYPTATLWNYHVKLADHEFTSSLTLVWAPEGSSISDAYLPDEISAEELWKVWIEECAGRPHDRDPQRYRMGEVPISWSVTGSGPGVSTFEAAPYQPDEYEDFLTHYTHPINATSGEMLNWMRLPVADRGWNESTCDKGGFVQEATGWKPSPFQPVMDVFLIGAAAGLYVPESGSATA